MCEFISVPFEEAERELQVWGGVSFSLCEGGELHLVLSQSQMMSGVRLRCHALLYSGTLLEKGSWSFTNNTRFCVDYLRSIIKCKHMFSY